MKTKIISFLAIFSVLNTIPAFAAGGGGFSTMEEVIGEDESASTPVISNNNQTSSEDIQINVDLDFEDSDALMAEYLTEQQAESEKNLPLEIRTYEAERKLEEAQAELLNNNTQNDIPPTITIKQNMQQLTTGPDMQKLKDTVAGKQGKVDDAKAKEQSNANKLLTAGATAAAGIGGMELMQGISEQKSTKESEQSMASYIATMRCRYGNGKQIKAGTDEIELPGGNNSNIMQYRSEYFTLAKDLKERKVALNMTPGIESEEILDKSQMGLYDDENLGMNSGAYSSVYRAQMYNSETDATQIDDAKQTAKNRMIGGGVATGVGVAGGIVGDQLLNGELGQKIKDAKNKK